MVTKTTSLPLFLYFHGSVTVRELELEDGSWLSALDASRWLQHVSQCLKLAVYVCDIMAPDRAPGMSVILKGEKGKIK